MGERGAPLVISRGVRNATVERPPAPHDVSLRDAARVWLRIALLSFGGPAGQIAVMHRILVDEKRWISDARFLHALNYCMLLPGPEAQQLATYVGWLMHRTAGGLLAGLLFIAPGVVAIMALSWVHAAWSHAPLVAGFFFGLKAGVIAVVFDALGRIGRRALKTPVARALAIAAFLALSLFAVPFPVVIAAAGALGVLASRGGRSFFLPSGHGATPETSGETLLGDAVPDHARPDGRRCLRTAAVWLAVWLGPVLLLVLARGPDDVFARIAVYFSQVAAVTFGGAYAVLAYVAQHAVETLHWLTAGEMLDGLGMAETTPGPLITVLQFVGFMAAFHLPGALPPLVAGTLGGLVATWVTFAPCFLWILAGAPYVEALRGNKVLASALGAVSAAVVGVIGNLAVWFAIHTLFHETRRVRPLGLHVELPVLSSIDVPAVLLAAAAAAALMRFKAGVVPTLAACALLGAALRWGGLA